MSRGLIYLLTGPAHAARMVVSLWNLRKHNPDLPVTIYTTHYKSYAVALDCMSDDRMGDVSIRQTTELAIKKNRQFISKVHLMPSTPYDVCAYLDADTLPMADISPMLDGAEEHGFCATQFCNWLTTGKRIQKRLDRLAGCVRKHNANHGTDVGYSEAVLEDMLAACSDEKNPLPSVNGGVFAARRDSPLLRDWYNLSMAGRRAFICDEAALHLVLTRHKHAVLKGGQWNCSGHLGGEIEGPIKIWHFHGEKHINRDSSKEIWLPAFEEVWEANIADIQSWAPAGDGDLESYLKETK